MLFLKFFIGPDILKNNNKRLCIKTHFMNYNLKHFYTLFPSLQSVRSQSSTM